MKLAILNPTILAIFTITVLILSVVNPKPFIAAWEWIKEYWHTLHPSDKVASYWLIGIVCAVSAYAHFAFI